MNLPHELAVLWPAGVHGLRLAGAWCLTYLVHSTLLLAGAWCLSRLVAGRAPRAEETIWRLALFAGFFTASLQLGWPALSREAATLWKPATAPVQAIVLDIAPLPAAVAPSVSSRTLPLELAAGATAAWAGLALAGSGFLLLAASALRRRLRGRREVADREARQQLDELLSASGERPVRLTETPSLAVPIALGVMRREICLPRRVLSSLGERERRALLAHELAHHARRDPAWLLLARLAETVGSLQPFNRVARRRLIELSEWLADARAVRWTGDPEGLARCLAEVASWGLPVAQARLAPGFATESRRLVGRVRRLLDRGADEVREIPLRWVRLGSGLAAVALVAFAPGLAPGSFAADTTTVDPVEQVGAARPTPVTVPAPAADPAPVVAPESADENTPEPADREESWTVDGRRWSELTPEEREAVRREVRQARKAMRDAAREARRAMEKVRREMPSSEELARQIAEAQRATAEGMHAASAAMAAMPSAAELREIEESARREAARHLEKLEQELRQGGDERRREIERAIDQLHRELASPEALARLHAEAALAAGKATRELSPERRLEVERLIREMSRLQAEIAPQLRELERLGEQIGREVASAFEDDNEVEAPEEVEDVEAPEAPEAVGAPPPPLAVAPPPPPAVPSPVTPPPGVSRAPRAARATPALPSRAPLPAGAATPTPAPR